MDYFVVALIDLLSDIFAILFSPNEVWFLGKRCKNWVEGEIAVQIQGCSESECLLWFLTHCLLERVIEGPVIKGTASEMTLCCFRCSEFETRAQAHGQLGHWAEIDQHLYLHRGGTSLAGPDSESGPARLRSTTSVRLTCN